MRIKRRGIIFRIQMITRLLFQMTFGWLILLTRRSTRCDDDDPSRTSPDVEYPSRTGGGFIIILLNLGWLQSTLSLSLSLSLSLLSSMCVHESHRNQVRPRRIKVGWMSVTWPGCFTCQSPWPMSSTVGETANHRPTRVESGCHGLAGTRRLQYTLRPHYIFW